MVHHTGDNSLHGGFLCLVLKTKTEIKQKISGTSHAHILKLCLGFRCPTSITKVSIKGTLFFCFT